MDLNEQFNRVNQTILQYYEDAPYKPTYKDWVLWIENLEEPMKSSFQAQGFENCKRVLPFQRFYLELHDDGLQEYMKAHLDAEDFEYYKRLEE